MKTYGIVTKGNGEAWIIFEKHMTLSVGGGQAGQGYPCVLVYYSDTETFFKREHIPCVVVGEDEDEDI